MPETPASNPEPPTPQEAAPGPSVRRERVSDPERMKALAHPARITVFDYLSDRRVRGVEGATATEIAEAADMTPSAMSYHLRTLAKAGFIEEAPSRGDARERLWRLRMLRFDIGADKDAPESDRVVDRAMSEVFHDRQERSFERWLEIRDRVDPELRELATVSQGRLRLTPEEVEELKERFLELLDEFGERTRDRLDRPADGSDGTIIVEHLWRLFPKM